MAIFSGLIGILITAILLAGSAVLPPRQDTLTPEPGSLPVWVSPTPDEAGVISVVVQPGESLWVIAARAGLTLPDLLALNNLTEQSIINPGDILVIGYVTPEATVASPVEGSPTATRPPPTPRPTEPRSEATICLTAFDDRDRDGIFDPDEPLRAGVAFTIYDSQAVVANYITDGVSEPKCIGNIAPGEYRVTRSMVPGEVLTTAGDWALNVSANSRLYQAFGSFIPDSNEPVPPAATAVAQTTNEITVLPTRPAGGVSATSIPNNTAATGSTTTPWRIVGAITLFLGGLTLLAAVLILLFRQGRGRQPAASASEESDGTGRRFKKIDDLD